MFKCLLFTASVLLATIAFQPGDWSGVRVLQDDESNAMYGGIDLCLQYKPVNNWECNASCCSWANMATYDDNQTVATWESFNNVLCDVFKPDCWYYWQNDFTGCAGT